MFTNRKHLLVVISGHGYGHAAMTAPLVNRLRRDYPGLKITIRTSTPAAFLATKFALPYDHINEAVDFGMINRDAFEVDQAASLALYQTFHQHWPQRVATEAARLKELKVDAVLSNIAYLPLAAAKEAGIPALAFCCLNWADIFEHYYGHREACRTILDQIAAAYHAADLFIRPEPAMPMARFQTISVGPIAVQGKNIRAELLHHFSLPDQARLVPASMGGIRTELHLAQWPQLDNTFYLLPDGVSSQRPDQLTIDPGRFAFSDVLASADLFLTKPGYGAFSEAAVNRVPLLYVNRADWPEYPYLSDWLAHHLPCTEISRNQLESGDFAEPLTKLLDTPRPQTAPHSGEDQCLSLVSRYLN